MRRKQPTKAQKEAAQARRKAVQQLVGKVSKMTEQERQALMSRFGGVVSVEGKPLSLFNTCLLLTQDEQASMVGGFRQWQAVGRQVRKGEKGLAMWFPLNPKKSEPQDSDEEAELRFGLATVFDIRQTDERQAEAEG